MRKNKTIPSQGQWSDISAVIGENFNRQYMNLLELQFDMYKFCGMYQTLQQLQDAVTQPEAGMYAYILDFHYDPKTWNTEVMGEYDPKKQYSNIYSYIDGVWKVIGVNDGANTIIQGGGNEEGDGDVLPSVLTQQGGDAAFSWNGDLLAQQTVGNVASGQTFKVGTSLEYILRKIFFKAKEYHAASMSVSGGGGTILYGTEPSSITITITKRDSGVLTALSIYDPYTGLNVDLLDKAVLSGGVYTVTYSPSEPITKDGTFVVTAKLAATEHLTVCSLSDSVYVYVGYKWYCGKVETYNLADNPLPASIVIINARSGYIRNGSTMSVTTEGPDSDNHTWYIAYPSIFKLSVSKMIQGDSEDVTDNYEKNFKKPEYTYNVNDKINGINYTVSALTATRMPKITFTGIVNNK